MHASSYCWQQKILHWVSALVILWVLLSGFFLAFAVTDDWLRYRLANFNVALGTLYIPVFLLRCWFRVGCRQPSSFHTSGFQPLLACGVHLALYGATAWVLLSGVLMMSRRVELFGGWGFGPLIEDAVWQGRWAQWHLFGNGLLAALVAVHVLAVVVHEFSGRRVLRRMC